MHHQTDPLATAHRSQESTRFEIKAKLKLLDPEALLKFFVPLGIGNSTLQRNGKVNVKERTIKPLHGSNLVGLAIHLAAS